MWGGGPVSLPIPPHIFQEFFYIFFFFLWSRTLTLLLTWTQIFSGTWSGPSSLMQGIGGEGREVRKLNARWPNPCPFSPPLQSLEDLEDQKRKKKKEKMGFGSISRVFARGKQRKSLDPGLFDGTAPDYYIEEDADW